MAGIRVVDGGEQRRFRCVARKGEAVADTKVGHARRGGWVEGEHHERERDRGDECGSDGREGVRAT